MEVSAKKMATDINSSEKQNNEELDEGYVLTYDILRLIFKYLCAYDLCNAARVCSSWNEAASKEAATRRSPAFACNCLAVDYYEETKGVSHVTVYPGKELDIISTLGLIFVKVDGETEDWEPQNCWCNNLPLNCKSAIFGCYDTVANECKTLQTMGTGVGVFLPKAANIKCEMFSLYDNNISYNRYVKLVQQMLPVNGESKCIIMVRNQIACTYSLSVTRVLLKRYKPGTISLWGGISVGMKLCGESKWQNQREVQTQSSRHTRSALWMAITLCGPSLQSWSVVISNHYRSEKKIEEKLQKFREGLSLKKYSVGLMFACRARVQIKDREIAAFKKVFPEVPLYGLYGDGEIGLNTLNKSRESKLEHVYSTIYLILTYQ